MMNRYVKRFCQLGCVIGLIAGCRTVVNEEAADIVIYGGTSSAITAAIQGAKMGKTVIMVSPDKHLGGLTSGGLGCTDAGKRNAIGGLSLEFYKRIYDWYSKKEAWDKQTIESYLAVPNLKGSRIDKEKSQWLFEPHVAEAIYEKWLAQYPIKIYRNEWLDRKSGVEKVDGNIKSIKTLNGKKFVGKVFIDATYEGDLMASAGVSYHVGREANSVYGEKYNGIQLEEYNHHKHYFMSPISPYKVPGDPKSGLLFGVSAENPGKIGDGDNKVQAYCFRTCLTRNPKNRVPFPKPDGYNPENYELLLRDLLTMRKDFFEKFDAIPNLKTDTNNHGAFSSDFVGANYDYPDADYARRREIIKAHEVYQKGYYYFVANDPRVPEFIRNEMAQWGLAADEFNDNGHWPHQLYVREARRMIGQYVMTENDILSKREIKDPVGMGSYTLDSHTCQRYVTKDGFVQNEGDIGHRFEDPYKISYGSIVPKKNECKNLIVPVCVSSSHIAFGSIRMEPVFMILGQSAATAASQAIDENVAVQDVDYSKLNQRLKSDGQVY